MPLVCFDSKTALYQHIRNIPKVCPYVIALSFLVTALLGDIFCGWGLVDEFVEEPVDEREHHAESDGSAQCAHVGALNVECVNEMGAEQYHCAVDNQ